LVICSICHQVSNQAEKLALSGDVLLESLLFCFVTDAYSMANIAAVLPGQSTMTGAAPQQVLKMSSSFQIWLHDV